MKNADASLWENNHISVLDSQRARPNYLKDIFPREIHAYHTFSERDQEWIRIRERDRLLREGYQEQPDGSWTHPKNAIAKATGLSPA